MKKISKPSAKKAIIKIDMITDKVLGPKHVLTDAAAVKRKMKEKKK